MSHNSGHEQSNTPDASKPADNLSEQTSPNSPEQKKPADEITVSRWSVVSVVALAVLLIGGLLAGMFVLGVFPLPFTGDTGDSGGTLDSDPIWEALKNGGDSGQTGDSFFYEVAYDDFAAELARAPFCDEYSAVFRVSVSANSGGVVSRSTTVSKLWVSGEKYRVEVYSGSKLLRSSVCDGENVLVTDYATYESEVSKLYPASGDFTYESAAGIPSIDQFLDRATLSEASGVSELSITGVRGADVNAFRVDYKTELPPQTEEVVISLEYGVATYAQTIDADGYVSYSASLSSVSRGLTGYGGDTAKIFSTGK